MSEEKTCGSCTHGGEMSLNMVGWRHCLLAVAQVPVGNDFHTHRDDCPCPLWAAKPPEPTEYRPSDGPFWAQKTGNGWSVLLREQDGRNVLVGRGGIQVEELAREVVDACNQVCRKWATAGDAALHWIPCSERRPNTGVIVLVYVEKGCTCGSGVMPAYRTYRNPYGDWLSIPAHVPLPFHCVTHWMPLPEGPL